jgi:hypothetical protein
MPKEDEIRERRHTDKALIDCIQALYKSIENKTTSPEL